MNGTVTAVCRSGTHSFSKETIESVTLVEGLGVAGDAHSGVTVKHRSRVKLDPTTPNLRQVHLIHAELFDALRIQGFAVEPGAMGENVTTSGIPLLDLSVGTRLHLGPSAIVEITGLRNPCAQIDTFQKGLLKQVLDRDAEGRLIRKAGIMGIVIASGVVRPGDTIGVAAPDGAHRPLEPV